MEGQRHVEKRARVGTGERTTWLKEKMPLRAFGDGQRWWTCGFRAGPFCFSHPASSPSLLSLSKVEVLLVGLYKY